MHEFAREAAHRQRARRGEPDRGGRSIPDGEPAREVERWSVGTEHGMRADVGGLSRFYLVARRAVNDEV